MSDLLFENSSNIILYHTIKYVFNREIWENEDKQKREAKSHLESQSNPSLYIFRDVCV